MTNKFPSSPTNSGQSHHAQRGQDLSESWKRFNEAMTRHAHMEFSEKILRKDEIISNRIWSIGAYNKKKRKKIKSLFHVL